MSDIETEFPTETFGDDFLNDENIQDDFFVDDDESMGEGTDPVPGPTTFIPEMMNPQTGVAPVPVAPIPIPPVYKLMPTEVPKEATDFPTSFTSSPTRFTSSPTTIAEAFIDKDWISNNPWPGQGNKPTDPPVPESNESLMNPWPVSGQPAHNEWANNNMPHNQPHPSKTPYPTWSPTEQQPTYHPTATYPPTFKPTATFYPTKGPPTVVEPSPKPTHKPFTFPPSEPLTGEDIEKYDRPKPTEPPTPGPTLNPTPKPSKAPTMRPTQTPKQTENAGLKGDFSKSKFVGFQSNWGPAHPGSMTYDFTRNSIYVSGTTIPKQSNSFQRSICFVGALPIADIELWKTVENPVPPRADDKFSVPDSLNEQENMGCHLIFHDDTNSKKDVLFVGGVREPDATTRMGSIKPFFNHYKRSRNKPDWKLAGKSDEYQSQPQMKKYTPAEVSYPIAMAAGSMGKDQDTYMVAFVASDDNLLTEEYIENGDAVNANNMKNALQPAGLGFADPSKYAVPKRGTNFFMSINEYTFTDKNEVMHRWGQDLRPGDKEKGEVFPTAIANRFPKGQEYLFAGHVRGYLPNAWVAPYPIDANGKRHFDDLDGFVSMIKFPQTRPSWVREGNQRFSSIEMDPHLDDMVHGICMGPMGDNGKYDEYYVVGSTYGTMPPAPNQEEITTNIISGGSHNNTDGDTINRLSAWVTKVSLNTQKPVWTTQLYATSDYFSFDGGKTEAFDCHVIDTDDSRMYIAGTVYAGGIMNSNEKSAGSDDVWVAQLATNDGSIRWIRQIGSSGRDRLARTNGVEADLLGNAIIYGETTGELYRARPGEAIYKKDGSSTDIFVTTLDIDSGMSESTIESDRSFEKVRNVSIGTVLFILASLLICFCVCFRRTRTRKKLASRGEVDGVLSDATPAFKDEPDAEDFSNGHRGYSDNGTSNGGFSDSPQNGPPSEAFQDNKVV